MIKEKRFFHCKCYYCENGLCNAKLEMYDLFMAENQMLNPMTSIMELSMEIENHWKLMEKFHKKHPEGSKEAYFLFTANLVFTAHLIKKLDS
jgi:hypothetical protein